MNLNVLCSYQMTRSYSQLRNQTTDCVTLLNSIYREYTLQNSTGKINVETFKGVLRFKIITDDVIVELVTIAI